MNHSLRQQLLAWVLIPLVCAIAVDAWTSYNSALETASVVQDRLLLGSARMIAQQISFEDGSFQHQIPPAALELFQAQELDRIYYRVTTGAGQLLAGYTALAMPKNSLPLNAPFFFGSTMRGEGVRVVAFYQPVIGAPSTLPVVVEVAQTLHAHDKLMHDLWQQTLVQQLLILILAAVFILFGLRRGLQPLIRLRTDVLARHGDSLLPLQTNTIPSELTPLVTAFNDYLQRRDSYVHERSVFVQNAAHQLRTPLTVLGTQISDALRSDSTSEAQKSLRAARLTLQNTTRLVNQFLALSLAEASVATMSAVSTQMCCDLVQEVLEQLAVAAHNKQIDLGFERHGVDTVVSTDLAALREIAINLIDNAIRYTPEHGIVTAKVHSAPERLTLSVQDNGPGIAVELRERIFERFYRIDGSNSSGSGLGLAIVKELAAQCGGSIELGTPVGGESGVLAAVHFSVVSKQA